jgi:uncharacterized membrane protein YhaH (DUF805 family)
MDWYMMVWQRYADFNGRSRRREYWMFALFNALIGAVVGMIAAVMFTTTRSSYIGVVIYGLLCLYFLAALIPSLAVSVRRLHDIGMTGWMLLIGLVPLIGSLALLVMSLLDGNPGPNQYGPNPKATKQMAMNQ